MPKPVLRWILIVLAASPALFLAAFIASFAIDFPFADQWDPGISGLFIKANNGEFRIADLWAQHNEHRMALPKLAMLLLGWMTCWNTICESWFQWALACLTSLGLLVILRRTFRDSLLDPPSSHPPTDPWLRILPIWFVLNLFIFSIRQWENWLSGIGIANVMVTTWIVAMVVAATSSVTSRNRAILTGLCAFAATITSGNGWLAWPLGAILLGFSTTRQEFRDKRGILLGWSIAFVLVLAIYFIGYRRPPLAPDTPEHYGGLSMLLSYPIAFTGAPFAAGLPMDLRIATMIAGVTQCLIYLAIIGYLIHIWRRHRMSDLWIPMLPWVVLGLFAFGSGVVAAPMRARLGIGQAASSRYVTFAMFMPIALAVMIPAICAHIRQLARPSLRPLRLWTQFPAVLFGAVVPLELIAILLILRQYAPINLQRHSMKAATLLLNVFPGNRFITPPGYPDHPGMEDRARELSRIGYLRPPLIEGGRILDARTLAGPGGESPQPPDKWGAMEGIQRTSTPGQIIASGWAISPTGTRPADLVLLTLVDAEGKHNIIGPAITGADRPDIFDKLGDYRYAHSGWTITGSFPNVPPGGQYLLTAWVLDSSTGKTYRLAGQAVYQQ